MDRSEAEALLRAYRAKIAVTTQKGRDQITYDDVQQLIQELPEVALSIFGPDNTQLEHARVPFLSQDDLYQRQQTAHSTRIVTQEEDVARIHVPQLSFDSAFRRALSELDERVVVMLLEIQSA